MMPLNSIGDLWLEVTRRCNMSCTHCCRGEAQDIDMDCNSLMWLLEQTGSVGMLGFTGGEPTIAPEKMLEILQTFKTTNTPVNILEMVTNGKDISDHFIYAWAAWLDYCSNPGAAQVYVSTDEFHERVDVSRLSDTLNCSVRLRGLEQVLAEGRMSNDSSLSRVDNLMVTLVDNNITSPVYLSCEGNLLSGVDWSYQSQEQVRICNVVDTDVLDGLKEWGK